MEFGETALPEGFGGQPPRSRDPYSGDSVIDDEEAVRILLRGRYQCGPVLSRPGYRCAKRILDVVISGCALIVLALPAVALCAIILVKSPGASPIYTQWRVGRLKRDGSIKVFRMHKFRSMVPRAHEQIAHLQDRNEADGPLFKIKDDPRVIPGVGSFIRRHSIDELMQLWDVLVGNMTLIGPRPPLPREVLDRKSVV